jgi:chemotaxis protein MotA
MMKPSSAMGIGIATVGILLGALMGGTSPSAFIDIPAFLIIFGGTFGVTMASCGWESMRQIPKLYRIAFATPVDATRERIALMVSLAEQARREGLLALDETVRGIDDDFTRKGLQLVVDGIDPDLVREVLEAEIEGMLTRHRSGAAPFDKAGGFAPTMGIIGTVMGLVHVLQNLSAPSTLGPSISTAFVATLLGIGSANVVYLPVANRLKALSASELTLRTLTMDGILAVQAGDNPRVVEEKLSSYLPPTARVEDGSDEDNVAQLDDRRAAEAAA